MVKPTLVYNTAHYTGCAKKTHPEAPVVLAPCHTVKQTWVSLTKSPNGKKEEKKKPEGSFLLWYQLTLEISSGNWQRANNFDLAPCWQKMHHRGKALQLEPRDLDISTHQYAILYWVSGQSLCVSSVSQNHQVNPRTLGNEMLRVGLAHPQILNIFCLACLEPYF